MAEEPLADQSPDAGGSSPVNGHAAMTVDALALAEAGYRVFPLFLNKKPMTQRGFLDATTDAATVSGWWGARPQALIGIAVPDETIVVDLDTYKDEYRADHGLAVPSTPLTQQTRQGGFQLGYRTDGRQVRQTEGEAAPAIDTRVAGKGYVVAWEPEVFLDKLPSTWAPAPEWVYARPSKPMAGATPETMATRSEILSWLGTIAGRATVTKSEYLALLGAARDDGRIVARDAARPWTDEDLDKLAAEAAKWEQAKEGGFTDEPESGYLRLPPPDLEPAAPRLLSPLICDSRTMWYGAQAVGKGVLLVVAVAALADADAAFIPGSAIGAPIRVGILDWEDNRDEWAERLHRMQVPAESVPYREPRGPLTHPKILADVRAWVDGEGVELVAVDSVIPAAGGVDAMKPEAPTAYYSALRQLERPSLSLGHVPKDKAQGQHPFGSTYWATQQRLIWRIERIEDGSRHLLKLVNTKHSRWPWTPDMLMEVGWSEAGPLRVRSGLNLTEDPAPLIDRIVLAVTVGGSLTAEAIAERVGSDSRTVRRTVDRHPQQVAGDDSRPTVFGLPKGAR